MSLDSRAVPRGEGATITHSKPGSAWPAPHAFVHTKHELSKAKTLTCNAESSKSNRAHAHQNNDDKHSILFAQGSKVSELLQLQSHGIRTKERSYGPPAPE